MGGGNKANTGIRRKPSVKVSQCSGEQTQKVSNLKSISPVTNKYSDCRQRKVIAGEES